MTRPRRGLVLHHDANSTSGIVGRHLTAWGWDLVDFRLCEQPRDPTPARPMPSADDLDDMDLLVLTGSQWSVYDHDLIGGWIDDELDLVRGADRRGVAVLGLCFGGQVLAAALGGSVEEAPAPEVGWHTIQPNAAAIDPGPWFQWHFDRFHPPSDATILATSPAATQAFVLRRNLGLQFHPELDSDLLALWTATDSDELRAAGVDPDALATATRLHEPRAAGSTARLLRWFLDHVDRA